MRAAVATLQTAPAVLPAHAAPARVAWAAFRILRPGNGAMTAIGVGVGAIVHGGSFAVPFPALALAGAAGFLAAGFGNVLNDLTDRDLDKLAHPARPLPRGDLTPATARVLAGITAALALAFGLLLSLPAAGFVAATLLLMIAYETTLKSRGLVGNLAVAALTGAPFLFGALVVGGASALLGPALILAALASLANLGREVLKDVQDMHADVDRATLPRTHGRAVARRIAAGALLAAVAASPLPWLRGEAAWAYLPLVAVADATFLAAAFHPRADRAQSLAKVGMLVALAAFLAGEVVA